MNTLTSAFTQLVEKNPKKKAFAEKTSKGLWVYQDFKDWNKRSRALASALIDEGIEPGDNIAIFSYSKREWLEADMAILMAGAQTVTIYHNLTGQTVDYILNDASVKIVFAQGPLQLRELFGDCKDKKLLKSLKRIVYFQSIQRPLQRPGKPEPPELSISETVPAQKYDLLISFEDYVKKGKASLEKNFSTLNERLNNIKSDTIAKIVYTSGTTGQPKGVMLSHGNLTSVTQNLDSTVKIKPSDTTLLFLPLAHVYAQLLYHAQLRIGFCIAFAESMLTVIDDAESIKPDFFVSVPRLFEKMHSTILAQIQKSPITKKLIFKWSCSTGSKVSKNLQNKEKPPLLLSAQAQIAQKLVFSKLKKRLGGKVRMMISGGAPLSREIMEFFHAADLLILEGYGMTENASLSHHNHIDDYKFGTVGKALENTRTKIAEDGEILVKGPGVMHGYLNLPEETKQTIDKDGWLHTGDIGSIDKDGFLTIEDRKKDIIVTSGGKNIAPAPIEAALTKKELISQAVVLGNKRNYLVALITLDPEAVSQFAKKNNFMSLNHEHPFLLQAIEAEINSVNNKLQQYETIKKFAVLPSEFSIETNEVTPSLKLRKKTIENNYKKQIDILYEN